ncbi:MAG: hypothetical protein MI976_27135, partial [Pseudomonadales bacterium]|nr:hypothetical protein [Pseudomonadales bacterium]
MAMSEFPLLVWPIDNNNYLGQIIGTDYSVVDSSPAALRRSAAEFLTKAFKEDGVVEPPQIDNPVLAIYTVSVQMTYRETSGIYPLPGDHRIQVAAVHGDSRQMNFSECFLPLFDRSFYYYDKAQLKTLIEHFVREVVENCSPEDVIQYRMTTQPALDSIKVQATAKRSASYQREAFIPQALQETTDQLPLPARERK